MENYCKESLGVIAAVVVVSVLLAAMFVGIMLCIVCRNSRRASRHPRSTAAGDRGQVSQQKRNKFCCFKTDYSEGQRSDQNSMSDYEIAPSPSICCFNCGEKRKEESSNANYCITDSSFVFKNGKSLELNGFAQYTISSDKLSPTCDVYSAQDSLKNNTKNCSQPSTLKSQCNQKITHKHPDTEILAQKGPPETIVTGLEMMPTATTVESHSQGKNSTLRGDQTPPDEPPYTHGARLTRQNSEKRRELEKIEKAQENALKLRHVSPGRLRSASETIFGTNTGKETILDLLQSKEPEEVLALKIELISQIYEGLRLSDLSSDLVKEMTLEMEKLNHYVSLNLGRAFIDTFNLSIKAKSVTCAQLLTKTFKHRGSHISVSQFLHFLHQFGDRQVAETFCDLLIRWYRHETSRHKGGSAATTLHNNLRNHPHSYIAQGYSTPQFTHSHTISLVNNYPTASGAGHNHNPIVAGMNTPMMRHSLAVPSSAQLASAAYNGIDRDRMPQTGVDQYAHPLTAAQNFSFHPQQQVVGPPLMYGGGVGAPPYSLTPTPVNVHKQKPPPHHRFMMQEEASSECGEDDVFA